MRLVPSFGGPAWAQNIFRAAVSQANLNKWGGFLRLASSPDSKTIIAFPLIILYQMISYINFNSITITYLPNCPKYNNFNDLGQA
jgi:hypothetical protein